MELPEEDLEALKALKKKRPQEDGPEAAPRSPEFRSPDFAVSLHQR